MSHSRFSIRNPFCANAIRFLIIALLVMGLFMVNKPETPSVSAANVAALGLYHNINANGMDLDNFSAWLGRPVVRALGYTSRDSFASISGTNQEWLLDPAQAWVAGDPVNRRFILSIPMIPDNGAGGTSIATCGTGAYNSNFVTLGQRLVSRGLHQSVIRLAWEMNGSWFTGSYVGTNQTSWNNWKNCWVQIVTAMRGVSGQQFLFDFNPNSGASDAGAHMSNWYPGDAYVDIISLDLYDFKWADCTASFSSRWNARLTEMNGLNDLATFATQHNKPIAFDEWGLWENAQPYCGGGDDPQFIDAMADWFETHNVAWQTYFDVLAAGDHRLSSYPNSQARYKARFGSVPAATNTPANPTNTPVPGGNTHGGTWAVKGTLTGTWNNMYQNIAAATNTSYVASVWIKGSGTIRLRAFNASWSTELATVDCTASGSWTNCTTPAFNTGSNSTVVFAVADAAGGTMYLDDAFIGVSGSTNKLANAGFESGNTNWTIPAQFVIQQPGGAAPTATNTVVSPTATKTNTPVPPTATKTNTPVPPTATNTSVPGGNTHGGIWAAKGTFTGSWNNMYQNAPAATNNTYVVSIWIKGSGTIRLRAFNASWSTILATVDCTATGTWTKCSTPTFNTGSNTTVVFAVADAAGGTMYLDDAFLGVSGSTNRLVNPGYESGNVNWTIPAQFTIIKP